MKQVSLTLALILCSIVLVPHNEVHSQKLVTPAGRYAANQLLVKFKADAGQEFVPSEAIDEMWSRNGIKAHSLKVALRDNLYLVKLDDGTSVEDAIERAAADPRVEYAEPDFLLYPATTMPNDALFSQMWGLMNIGLGVGKPGADISATRAWDLTTGSPDVVVAVIDTGADLSHPDLAPNAWVNTREVAGNGVDDDNNGYVDDINGWNFRSNNNRYFDDPQGDFHGTHVSGTIGAAGNNGIGVAGVAWRVKIMSLKFIGKESGATSDAVKAINYVIDQKKRGVNVRVINASWIGAGTSSSLRKAITDAGAAGILFVAAAGNGGDDHLGDDMDRVPDYPGAWGGEIDSLISVAALDRADKLASFSNYGHSNVNVGAPGVEILSTLPGGGYGYASGTSMATPHVAGIAALLWASDSSLKPSQVKQRIISTSTPVLALASIVSSSGRANAYNALTRTFEPPDGPQVASVNTNKKWLTVNGIGIVRGETVVEVNGVAQTGKTKYINTYSLADGSPTRFKVKLGKTGMNSSIPVGTQVTVTLFDPATGRRSAPFFYVR